MIERRILRVIDLKTRGETNAEVIAAGTATITFTASIEQAPKIGETLYIAISDKPLENAAAAAAKTLEELTGDQNPLRQLDAAVAALRRIAAQRL